MICAVHPISYCNLLKIKRFVMENFCEFGNAINFRGTSTDRCKQAYNYYCRETNTKYLNNMTLTMI